MDNQDQEKERGITILAKNLAVIYKETKLNILDTPGHADFGGEVERVLHMADGVLLVVDSVEGPKPQTRFVLDKALQKGMKALVVVNKIDRPAARPDYVVDSVFDLFVELGASDEQTDFSVVYASGLLGKAGYEPHELQDDMSPLLDVVLEAIDPPSIETTEPEALQCLVSNVSSTEREKECREWTCWQVQCGLLIARFPFDFRLTLTPSKASSALPASPTDPLRRDNLSRWSIPTRRKRRAVLAVSLSLTISDNAK